VRWKATHHSQVSNILFSHLNYKMMKTKFCSFKLVYFWLIICYAVLCNHSTKLLYMWKRFLKNKCEMLKKEAKINTIITKIQSFNEMDCENITTPIVSMQNYTKLDCTKFRFLAVLAQSFNILTRYHLLYIHVLPNLYLLAFNVFSNF
jgi:hypothetical protein